MLQTKNKRHGLYVILMMGMSNCQSWLITDQATNGTKTNDVPYIIDDPIIARLRCLLSKNSLKYTKIIADDPDMLCRRNFMMMKSYQKWHSVPQFSNELNEYLNNLQKSV